MHAPLEMVPGLGQFPSYDWELLGRVVPGQNSSKDSSNRLAIQTLQFQCPATVLGTDLLVQREAEGWVRSGLRCACRVGAGPLKAVTLFPHVFALYLEQEQNVQKLDESSCFLLQYT